MTAPDVQALIDDYAALGQQAVALATRVAAMESQSSALIEPRHMRLVGGYRIPELLADGKSVNGSDGSFDLRRVAGQTRIIMHHSRITQRLVEFAAGPMGDPSQAIVSWPQLSAIGASVKLFQDEAPTYKINPFGVLWDDESQSVLASSRHSYTTSSADPLDWLARINVGSGVLATASVSRLAPQCSNDFYGGGFTHIPPSFRQHVGGRRIACAYGGYDRNANPPTYTGSSMGPSFAALADDMSAVNIINYPKGKSCVRDSAYNRVIHDLPADAMKGLLKPRVGTNGYWQHDSAYDPAFVDHPSFHGLAYMGSLTRGCLDYRAQDVGWNRFVVKDPNWFYSPANTAPGHGTRHPSVENWNQGQPDGITAPVMLVYDPAHLAEVAAGSRLPHDCVPRQYDFACPIPGSPTCMRWDAATNNLWVMVLGAHGPTKLPALLRYELSRDASVNPPMKMPPGYVLDSSGAMVAA